MKTTSLDTLRSKNLFLSTTKKVSLILIAGIAASTIIGLVLGSYYLGLLTNRAREFALAVSPSDIEQLKDMSKSDQAVPYEKVRQKLTALKAIHTETRFVYIMSRDQEGIKFLADSEPTDSPSYSHRGEKYADATDKLVALFDNKQSFTEGPVSDEYGRWYSALAPITDNSGKVVAVIGIDVPAFGYIAVVIGMALSPLLIALVVAIAMIVYDASRRRHMAAFRFQNELVSIASHELRTPISGLKWGQETLLKSELNDMQKKMLTIMYESTSRLQESLEDVLQLASLGMVQANKLQRAPTDLTIMIRDVCKAQQLAAQQRNIYISYLKGWPTTLQVNAEATKLRRVINNIISNAIKYAHEGTLIEFSYKIEANQHVITIRNQGIGIPASELPHVFDGMYRATNAVKSQATGTGMGLYLSRGIIEQHGGKLWIESTENVDTVVHLSLPIIDLAPIPLEK